MSPAQLEEYLHEYIPLSAAMQVSVVELADDAAVLRAPLPPNINHRETAFGGSVSALAILSAWSLLHIRLRNAGVTCRLVIQRNSIHYRLPIVGTFTARATLARTAEWEQFRRTLTRRGKARISVCSVLEHEGKEAACFSGEFVAVASPAAANG
jgi:thioesterase domain-containing protein